MSPELSSSHSAKNSAQKVAAQLQLKYVGKDSFIQLCKKGCDPEFLGENFYFITNNPETNIRSRNPKRKSYKLKLRPLDDIKFALGGFEKRQVEALQNEIKKVALDVEKLNS